MSNLVDNRKLTFVSIVSLEFNASQVESMMRNALSVAPVISFKVRSMIHVLDGRQAYSHSNFSIRIVSMQLICLSRA